jgi:hypothetical protein
VVTDFRLSLSGLQLRLKLPAGFIEQAIEGGHEEIEHQLTDEDINNLESQYCMRVNGKKRPEASAELHKRVKEFLPNLPESVSHEQACKQAPHGYAFNVRLVRTGDKAQAMSMPGALLDMAQLYLIVRDTA